MANKKTYRIVIDGVKESAESLSSLGGVLDKVNAKLEQQIDAFNKEYQKSIEENKRKLQELNKEVKHQVDLEKAQQIVAEGNVSTYKKKQELLTALGKVIKNMTTNTEAEIKQQQTLKAQYAQLNSELKAFDASLGNHQRNVGNYESGVVSLQSQLRELEMQMANMLANGVDKNSAAFQDLAKKAGTLKDAIGDAKEEVKRFASDTKGLDDVIQVAQVATAAFQLWKGAMSAFGVETEDAEKAIQKLAGAMSIIQSLKTLQEVMNQGGTAAKLLGGAMDALGLSQLKAAATTTGLTTAQKAAAVSSKALNVALRAIPLMLIIGLVADLINHWDDLVGWFNKTFPALSKLGGLFGKLWSTIKATGMALVTFIIKPWELFAEAIQKAINGDWGGVWDTLKKGLDIYKDTYEAFVKEYNESEEDRHNASIAKAAEANAKELKYQLDMLKAKKGNDAKYSKERIALQKEYFKQLKLAANGSKEDLQKIALDEAEFERELRENNLKVYQDAEKKEIEAKKEALEAEKKALQDTADLHKSMYDGYVITMQKIYNEAKEEYELFKTGSLDEMAAAFNRLQAAYVGLHNGNILQTINASFAKAHELMPLIAKDAGDWEKNMHNIFRNYKKSGYDDAFFENLNTEQHTFFRGLLNNLRKANDEANDFMNELWFNFQRDKVDVAVNNAEKSINKLVERSKLNKVSLWDRLFNPKKAKELITENTLTLQHYENESERILQELSDVWTDYINILTEEFGADSKRVQNAIDAQTEALKRQRNVLKEGTPTRSDKKPNSIVAQSTGMDYGEKTGAILDLIGNEVNMFADSVFNPINDAFAMMLAFQLEEAQAALEEAERMHEQSVERVEESKDRIQEINDAMREAEGTNLEELKARQADELNLLAQREAEEKRLAKEKEKREAEMRKIENKQRKNELKAQLAQTIVNTAQAVSKTYANYGWPLGGIFGAIIAALGLAQVNTISNQMSKFANGGVLPSKYANGGVIDGKSHAQGGVKVFGGRVELEGNEMIVNKKDTSRYLDVLQKINRNDPSVRYLQGNHGNVNDAMKKKFADGGTLNYQSMNDAVQAADMVSAIRTAVEGIHPQVAVVDIAKGMRNVTQVRELSGAKSLM